jgi:hypothetical protein
VFTDVLSQLPMVEPAQRLRAGNPAIDMLLVPVTNAHLIAILEDKFVRIVVLVLVAAWLRTLAMRDSSEIGPATLEDVGDCGIQGRIPNTQRFVRHPKRTEE